MKKFKVGFIGTGNIATAIFGGIVNSGYIKSENICVFDPDNDKAMQFASCGATALEGASAIASSCDFVFLTVKPQIYDVVLSEIKDCVGPNTCLIDVAAGISIDYVKGFVGEKVPVVRVMPNTPLMYGFGASALVNRSPVTEEQFAFVRGCFDSCGVTVVVDENHINTVTAISGSAPAYVMRFMNDFIAFATEAGMDSSDAAKLIAQVFLGSSQMVVKDERTITELIRAVTSPNGTTEAGLSSLDNNNFDQTVEACLKSTVKRAEELSK